ncbi:WD domain containing protein [Entamoeba histolytica]|uniref:Elongator complex protein 2 n=5 Tax=Entamoeba histolytica TaxID=5759 RepID=C4M5I3_ENTH1|nr:WD domain containing protein [Entamoeba histolytica HM-1:IMSS]EAL52213.2 WD domain containing protein [Entamoeba histolytica HM-1:IMSS]GAT96683.1 WD domain containing protein [Entamoeba histolytica]|eukprot:XP_657599.2 WD domain containing protein [Entamoeba histolytica HM-1:IMSS]
MTEFLSLGPNIQCNLKFSKDGKKYFFGNAHVVGVVNVESSSITSIIDFKQTVRSIEVINDTTIAVGTERGIVELYDLEQDKKTRIISIGEYPIINIKNYENYLLISSPLRVLLITLEGKIIEDISSKILIETATLFGNQKNEFPSIAYALTDAAGTLVIKQGTNEKRIPGNKTWVTALCQSDDLTRVFVGTDSGKVYVHQYPSLEVESVVSVSDLRISGISCHGNTTFIASSIDCSIQFFQLSDLWLSTVRLGGVGDERYIRFSFNERNRILIALTNMCHLHGWKLDSSYTIPTQIVLPTGHSQAVSSVELYPLPTIPSNLAIISSSLDYTIRLFVKNVNPDNKTQERWVEIARPLVHGYPLSQAVLINNPIRVLTSSIEEKPVRILEASKYFIESLRYITRSNLSEKDMIYYEKSPIGANHQPLSLTNCPLREHTGSSRQSQVQSPTKLQYDIKTLVIPDSDELPVEDDITVASVPKVYMTAPPEEELHYHTLWPETNKLLDQQSEVTHIAVSKDEQYIVTGGLYLKPSKFTSQPVPAKTLYLWEKSGETYKVVDSFLPFGEEDEIQCLVFEEGIFAVGGREGKVFIVSGEKDNFKTHLIEVCKEKITGLCYVKENIIVGTPSGQMYSINTKTYERDYGQFVSKPITAMKGINDKIILGFEDGSIDIISLNTKTIHFNKSANGKIRNCCPSKVISISGIERDKDMKVVASDDIGTIIVVSI